LKDVDEIVDLSFDKVADALYIRFSYEKVKESEEIADGIILDYNEGDKLIGIEVLNYSKRHLDLNELITLNSDEIIPAIVECQ